MSYTYKSGSTLHCVLCPHHCKMEEGERGKCGVRENRTGELSLPLYGVLSAVSTDPIEKKPLYHFYPGSTIFSVGFYGCSFHCPFCQNYRIAQPADTGGRTKDASTAGSSGASSGGAGFPGAGFLGAGRSTSPEELVENARRQGARSIAYTYSEPLVHFEWILKAAKIARSYGLKNVLVSNGFINPKPAEELLEVMDAANIDLKSFRPEFYEDIVGGKLEPVLAFIKRAAATIHVEVTTLVIPGYTDSPREITDIAKFLANIHPDIPLHLSCYYPAYKFDAPPTEPSVVFELADTAKEHLNFVYPGNVGLSEITTLCPKCGATLISRRGYRVEMPGISNGACSRCGHPVPFPL